MTTVFQQLRKARLDFLDKLRGDAPTIYVHIFPIIQKRAMPEFERILTEYGKACTAREDFRANKLRVKLLAAFEAATT